MSEDDLLKLGFAQVSHTRWLCELRHTSIPMLTIQCPCPGIWTWDIDCYSHDAEYSSPSEALIDATGYLIRFHNHVTSLFIQDFSQEPE